MTLYDFLYIDLERVQSLYAQMHSGLLNALETLHGQGEEKTTSGQVGGDPFGSLKHGQISNVTETQTQHISPHDIILSDVLSGLQELNLIKDDKSVLEVGNFVMLEGKVSFLDYELGKDFVDILPAIAGGSAPDISEIPKKDRKRALKAHIKEEEKILTIFTSIAKMLPWEVQMSISTPILNAWAVVDKKKLRDSIVGLGLMYGTTLTGSWSVLGIVDQLHDESSNVTSPFLRSEMASGFAEAAEGIKKIVGCPLDTIGITPLLLFRKLG